MKYSLVDCSTIQALGGQLQRVANELAMLRIYSDNGVAMELRESELELLFSELHGVMVGDFNESAEGTTERLESMP